jgi:hypothetical protein
MEDEPLQEPEENASVQTKEAKIQKIMKTKWNFFWKSYMHKDYFGNQIIKCIIFFVAIVKQEED